MGRQTLSRDNSLSLVRSGVPPWTERGRRRPRQSYHRRHDETAGKLCVRKNRHKRGSPPRCDILHGGRHVIVYRQQKIPPTGRRYRRRVRDNVEQGARDLRPAASHRVLCLSVRKTPNVGILLRLRRQVSWFSIFIYFARITEFYYVTASFIRANGMRCLDCRYVERPLYQYCEMDTDSAYIALAGDTIDDLVAPEHREHYFRHRSEWLPAECCDEHEDDYVQTRLTGLPWTAT